MNKNDYFDIKILILAIVFSSLIFVLGIIGVFKPINSTVNSIFEEFHINIRNSIADFEELSFVFNNISQVRDENKGLRERLTQINDELAQAKVQLDDVSYVLEKGLVDFNPDRPIIPARVLFYDHSISGKLFINKGSMDNISQDDIVVIGKVLLGEIEEVYEYYSSVMLITSPEYKLNVISLESNTRGLLKGNLTGRLEVVEILSEKALSVNDTFVTEGKDGKYTFGLYVGTVKRIIGTPSEPVKTAMLENNINFKNLDRLYVMKIK